MNRINQICSPGNFAISVLNDEIKHFKVTYEPGKGYVFMKDEYESLEALIKDKKEHLFLKFACPKGEKYSDSNFWMQQLYQEEHVAVIPLKKLCFRFIYRNSDLFNLGISKMPADLLEEYNSIIVDSITSDASGRELWKRYFLGKVSAD